jgi:hypothetical protein
MIYQHPLLRLILISLNKFIFFNCKLIMNKLKKGLYCEINSLQRLKMY